MMSEEEMNVVLAKTYPERLKIAAKFMFDLKSTDRKWDAREVAKSYSVDANDVFQEVHQMLDKCMTEIRRQAEREIAG